MTLYDNAMYREDAEKVCRLDLPWEKLRDRTILISGATGLIGSFLIDVLMAQNENGLNCSVFALCRNSKNAETRFSYWRGNEKLKVIAHDITLPLDRPEVPRCDFLVHLASNTHPVQYATDPIGTIRTNMTGLFNILEFAGLCRAERVAFASSNEVYGENRGDTELFPEDYCGYIDCNTLRAGYPESKRCGEALCQAYIAQKKLDIVIPRLTRSYGPTMKPDDSKAVSQFIRKGLAGEDIVLKSAGNQNYSFTYMADAVSGLLTVLLAGNCGEAYNIADPSGDITLKELAGLIAGHCGRKVVFDLPDAVESAGFSKATKALLDGEKLRQLGWKPFYTIKEGIGRTLDILREQND